MSEVKISGLGVSMGIRIGRALNYKQQINLNSIIDNEAINSSAELARLETAIIETNKELDEIIDNAKDSLGESELAILRTQQAFLKDPSFYPEIVKKITQNKLSAGKAVLDVVKYYYDLFTQLNDEYMRERASDIKDLGDRLICNLSGIRDSKLVDIDKEVILVAEEIKPSETVQMDKEFVQGFVTRKGSKTSHTAILARTLEIPAIMGLGDSIDYIKDGDTIIIDGESGICIVNPDSETIDIYRERMTLVMKEEELVSEYILKRAETNDSHKVEIAANIGNSNDTRVALNKGIDGIGLYRTEFLFMSNNHLPTEDEQYQAYRDVVKMMGSKPTIIRTIDIGGDKELPYLALPKETNPFLGYRAIRWTLNRKDIFITQLRAIIRASHYGKVKIMFPMISNLQEWRLIKNIFEEAKEQLRTEGILFDENIEIGMMVEIPSVAILADQFAKEVDFFSIGTNDLVQYTLAVDRMNENVAYLYDYFNPAILKLIKYTVDAAHNEGKWVGMCGDMAGDPMATPLLIGLGLDELSMDAGSILRVKKLISNLNYEHCNQLAKDLIQLSTAEEIEEQLKAYNKFLKN